jgi:hypothetical protein
LRITYKKYTDTIKVGTIIATDIVKKRKKKQKGLEIKRTEANIGQIKAAE